MQIEQQAAEPTTHGDEVANLAKWGAVLGVLAGALYLAIANAAWWVWVGNSAFRGIRAPRDIGLGIQCVLFAGGPFAAAGSVFWWTARSLRSRRRRAVMASLAGTGVTLVAFFYRALLEGPF
ncbi:MAG: hypothetical protein ACT452_19400 [Microthrixaceae bacterium]